MKKVSIILLAALCGVGLYVFRENIAPLSVAGAAAVNPTSFKFDVPPQKVLNAIVFGFSDARPISSDFYRSLPLRSTALIDRNVVFTAETRDNALFGRTHFSRAEDDTDIYLHSFGEPVLSSTYCALGHRLAYRAEFAVTVRPSGEGSLVTVTAINPRALKGFGGIGVHGPYPSEISVDATTIEEYSLLLYVGHLLKVTSMPPVVLPSGSCAQ